MLSGNSINLSPFSSCTIMLIIIEKVNVFSRYGVKVEFHEHTLDTALNPLRSNFVTRKSLRYVATINS